MTNEPKPKTFTDEQGVKYGNYGKLLKKIPEELTEYTIPDFVKIIGYWAFSNCRNMHRIKVDINNTNYCAEDDVLFNKTKTLLIRCSTKHKEYSIPNSVTKIFWFAFSDCCNLQSINLSNFLMKIGDYAFFGCSSLQSINIPDSVMYIGNAVFGGCCNLRNINIPDSVTKIGWYAFFGCNSLQSINIPDSVMYIGNAAFGGCCSLKNIKVSDNVNKAVLRIIKEYIK